MAINKPLALFNIEATYLSMFQDVSSGAIGNCVRWAAAVHNALALRGHHCEIEAGTLNWLIVPEHLDDGVSPTHFSYEFEPNSPMSKLAMLTGNLPEIHVWVAIPETNEIIDMTTKHLKAQCHSIAPDLKWLAPDPPQYLWAQRDRLPEGVYYKPFKEAKAIALSALNRLNVTLHKPHTCRKDRTH